MRENLKLLVNEWSQSPTQLLPFPTMSAQQLCPQFSLGSCAEQTGCFQYYLVLAAEPSYLTYSSLCLPQVLPIS